MSRTQQDLLIDQNSNQSSFSTLVVSSIPATDFDAVHPKGLVPGKPSAEVAGHGTEVFVGIHLHIVVSQEPATELERCLAASAALSS